MTYSQFIPTEKVIDTKRSPRAPINFVNTQISKNFTLTIKTNPLSHNQTVFVVDENTYPDFAGYVLLTENNINSSTPPEENQWRISLKKNDIPFVMVSTHQVVEELNKDNFGLAILDKEEDNFIIKLYVRKPITPESQINITSVILFERYENPDTVFSPIVGLTNGGGSGGGSGEWGYDDAQIGIFVQYFQALINQIDEGQEDIQEILNNLSERISTGELEANLVSAGTVSADRLIIEGNNIISEFDSFEEWKQRTLPHSVPLYLDVNNQVSNLVMEYGSVPVFDSVLGDWYWRVSTYNNSFPTTNINRDYRATSLPELDSADYYTYYLMDESIEGQDVESYYLKRDSYLETDYIFKSYTVRSMFPLEGELSTIYYDISEGNYFRWNGSIYTPLEFPVQEFLNKNNFPSRPISEHKNHLFRSRKTNIFYRYYEFERVGTPRSRYSLRLAPSRFTTLVGSRPYSVPWINLSPGRYVISYYIRTNNNDEDINPQMDLSIIRHDEKEIVTILAQEEPESSISGEWQRKQASFYVSPEFESNLFYLEFNFYTLDMEYYIDGIQLEQYPIDLSGYESNFELVASPFSRGGKILFDGSNLKAGSVTSAHGIFAEAAIKSADIGSATIGEAHIIDASITNVKIEDAAITNAKIKDAEIDNAKIIDLSVDKLIADELTGKKISADLIEVENLIASEASISVLSSRFADFYDADIVNATIDDATIRWANIEGASIEEISIGEGTAEKLIISELWVTSSNLGEASVENIHIVDGTIDNIKIADAAITNAKIADATIDNAKINSLSVDKLVADIVDSKRIAAELIDVEDLVADSIFANEVKARTGSLLNMEVISANIGNLDAGQISTGTLSVERLIIVDPDNTDSVLFELNTSKYHRSSDDPDDLEPMQGYWLKIVDLGDGETERTYYKYNYETESWEIENPSQVVSSSYFDGENIGRETIYGDRIIAKSIKSERLDVAELSAITGNVGVLDAGRIQSSNNSSFFDLDTGELGLGREFQYRKINGGNLLTLIDVDINFLHGSNKSVIEYSNFEEFPNPNHIIEYLNRNSFPHPVYIREYNELEVGESGLYYYDSTEDIYYSYDELSSTYVEEIGIFNDSYSYYDLENQAYYSYREPINPIKPYNPLEVGEEFTFYYDDENDIYYEYKDSTYSIITIPDIYIFDDTRFRENILYWDAETNIYYVFDGQSYAPNSLSDEISKISTLASGALQLKVFGTDPETYAENLGKIFDFTTEGLFISNPDSTITGEDIKLRLNSSDMTFMSKEVELAKFTKDNVIVDNIQIISGDIRNSLKVGSIKIHPRTDGEIESMDFLWIGG